MPDMVITAAINTNNEHPILFCRRLLSPMLPSWIDAKYYVLLAIVLTSMVLAAPAFGAESDSVVVPTPDKAHKCPVCGMMVYRYPDFIASVTFEDGHTAFFDGVKDMFKYLFNLAKYSPKHQHQAVRSLFVTEYYDMRPIDGRKALYVLGSDVFGPMGRELIPMANLDDAREFLKDHHGKRIVRYAEVTPALIRQLD